jgi:hypothetical protein
MKAGVMALSCIRVKPHICVRLVTDNDVCVEGNKEGFRWLARRCLELARHPDEGHIHLNHEGTIVEKNSLSLVFSMCPSTPSSCRFSVNFPVTKLLWLVVCSFVVIALLVFAFNCYG